MQMKLPDSFQTNSPNFLHPSTQDELQFSYGMGAAEWQNWWTLQTSLFEIAGKFFREISSIVRLGKTVSDCEVNILSSFRTQ